MEIHVGKIQYNSPVVLTFSILAFFIFLVDAYGPFSGLTQNYFMVGGSFNSSDIFDYFRIFSHVLGHQTTTLLGEATWGHILGNLTFILLLGPILEEKYGSRTMLLMVMLAALATGITNILFMSSALLGASGIVFMLIMLSSITDLKNKKIPLTFILVLVIFLGKELVDIFNNDNISQVAHLVGGGTGTAFGFFFMRK